jgi:hypothetical protein
MIDIVDGEPVMYLGDGVYAAYDGECIRLTIGDHRNRQSAVYLDVPTFANLILFAAQVRSPRYVNG